MSWSCLLLGLPVAAAFTLPNTRAPQAQRAHAPSIMSAAATSVSVESAVGLFGRLADSQHVFSQPIRTAASGFEFSSNTAIKPKWIIAYTSREPCGEDVDLPTHHTRWSSLLFADGASACARAHFDEAVCGAAYSEPLGAPKWSVPGKVLVDTKACAAAPSTAALDALWMSLGGTGKDELQVEDVAARLKSWAQSDDFGEAILFKEFMAELSK